MNDLIKNSANIRKSWLTAFSLIVALSWLNDVLMFYTTAKTGASLDALTTIGCLFILLPLLLAIPFGATYYCAFKKSGTKLLGFQLFFAPINLLSDTLKEIENGAAVGDMFLGLLILSPIIIFAYISYLRLYRLNTAIKQQEI